MTCGITWQFTPQETSYSCFKGVVMKTVMPQLKGKVDMKVANKVLNMILNA